MRRLCLSLAVAAVCAGPAVAQPDPVPKDGKVVIAIVISPADVPKLQSDFSLVPLYVDMLPGNKVPGFMKAFMEQDNYFSKEWEDKRNKWNELPLADLPLAELKNAGVLGGIKYRSTEAGVQSYGGRPLSDVDEAARYLSTDWQIYFNIRRDGIYTLLPELQKCRVLANSLKLRMRAEVKAGQFDKAIYTAQTFFGMANAMEQHPCLIGYLVGVACGSIGVGVLEEFIQQPGAPNLYWSFSGLDQPVLNLKYAYDGERILVSAQFEKVIRGPVSDAEMQVVLRQIKELAGMARTGDNKIDDTTLKYALLTGDAGRVAAARKFLIDTGLKADAVNAMSPLQVTVVHDLRQYEVVRENMFKVMPLPMWQAEKQLALIEADMKKRRSELLLAPSLVPAVQKVRQAQARFDQRIALLRTIEAVRLHAHMAGKLPEKLADIAVPVPVDPVSGKEFEYAVKDGTATLHGANPNEGNANTNRYYEIRLRK